LLLLGGRDGHVYLAGLPGPTLKSLGRPVEAAWTSWPAPGGARKRRKPAAVPSPVSRLVPLVGHPGLVLCESWGHDARLLRLELQTRPFHGPCHGPYHGPTAATIAVVRAFPGTATSAPLGQPLPLDAGGGSIKSTCFDPEAAVVAYVGRAHAPRAAASLRLPPTAEMAHLALAGRSDERGGGRGGEVEVWKIVLLCALSGRRLFEGPLGGDFEGLAVAPLLPANPQRLETKTGRGWGRVWWGSRWWALHVTSRPAVGESGRVMHPPGAGGFFSSLQWPSD